MNLFEQRYQKEQNQATVDEILNEILDEIYSKLKPEEKVKLRNRVLLMDPIGQYFKPLLEKAKSPKNSEKDFISQQIKLKTPIEQIMFYIDSPRQSDIPTQNTREDIRKRWVKDDLDLKIKGEKDPSVRIQTFIASYGVILAIIPVLSKAAATVAPNHVTITLSDTFQVMENWITDKIGTLNPFFKFGGGVFFVSTLYNRYQNQKTMDELSLNKNFDSQPFTHFIGKNKALEPLLNKIPPSEQVLLQHLASSTSDERLRLFLTADKEGRREILKRYPPTFAQRLDNLFRQYHIQNEDKTKFMQCFAIPQRLIEVATLQLLTSGAVVNRFLERLDKRRSTSSSSPSLSLVKPSPAL